MSEVNYRRNGMKYSTSGKCWGIPKKKGKGEAEGQTPKPKSSRERHAQKKDR